MYEGRTVLRHHRMLPRQKIGCKVHEVKQKLLKCGNFDAVWRTKTIFVSPHNVVVLPNSL